MSKLIMIITIIISVIVVTDFITIIVIIIVQIKSFKSILTNNNDEKTKNSYGLIKREYSMERYSTEIVKPSYRIIIPKT